MVLQKLTINSHVAWHMEGGMFLQFADRVTDFRDLLSRDNSSVGIRTLSESFCGVDDDQTFGTQGKR